MVQTYLDLKSVRPGDMLRVYSRTYTYPSFNRATSPREIQVAYIVPPFLIIAADGTLIIIDEQAEVYRAMEPIGLSTRPITGSASISAKAQRLYAALCLPVEPPYKSPG